jgi:hypothetical protein
MFREGPPHFEAKGNGAAVAADHRPILWELMQKWPARAEGSAEMFNRSPS